MKAFQLIVVMLLVSTGLVSGSRHQLDRDQGTWGQHLAAVVSGENGKPWGAVHGRIQVKGRVRVSLFGDQSHHGAQRASGSGTGVEHRGLFGPIRKQVSKARQRHWGRAAAALPSGKRVFNQGRRGGNNVEQGSEVLGGGSSWSREALLKDSASGGPARSHTSLPLGTLVRNSRETRSDVRGDWKTQGKHTSEGMMSHGPNPQASSQPLSFGSVTQPIEPSFFWLLMSHLPRNLEELKKAHTHLHAYAEQHPLSLTLSFSLLYVTLQSLSVPGCTLLNLLLSSLFGFLPSLALLMSLVTLGSLCSYALSSLLLSSLVHRWWPRECERLRAEVALHRPRLFNYILFLRLTPIFPSWFINIGSPIAGVPVAVFAAATFVGHLPLMTVQVQAGCVLSSLQSLSDLYSAHTLLLLFLLAALALVPALIKSGDPSVTRVSSSSRLAAATRAEK